MLSQILMLLWRGGGGGGAMGKLWLACTSLKKSFDDQANIKLIVYCCHTCTKHRKNSQLP